MKKYLKDLEPEEIIENLKKGLIIKCDDDDSKYFMVDNIICYIDLCGHLFVNADVPCYEHYWYFEVEETFEIKEPGLYKTRDGRKAFVHTIDYETNDKYPIHFVIEGLPYYFSSNKNGRYYKNEENNKDIISKWED